MLNNDSTTYLVSGLIISLITYYGIFIYKYWKIYKFAFHQNGILLQNIIILSLGNLFAALVTDKRANLLSFFRWMATNIGLPYGIWLGYTYMFVLNDPSEIKIVLNHRQCYEKAKMYERLNIIFRNSLLLIPYDTWKHRRRFYQKSYTPNVLKSFFPSFYKQSSDLLVEIAAERKDLLNMCNKYSFTNFFNTSAGLKGDKLLTEMDRFGKLLNMIQNEFAELILDPVTPTIIWYNFYASGRKTRTYLKEAKSILDEIIQAKRKQHINQQEYRDTNKDVHPLLDLIMNTMSYDKIFEELLLFATAATDASGVAMAFTLVLLGMHPQVQKAIYDEIRSTVGDDDDDPILYEHLPELQYTEAAICESLRILPPVPFIARKVSGDVDIGTKVLPNKINVVIDIFHLHRDPKYWPDPLEFDPTRFLPENASKILPYSYLPFSGGPRDCLGKRQAMTLLKVTVANVIRKFRITSKYKSVKDISLKSCLTLVPTHPLDCHFIPRFPK